MHIKDAETERSVWIPSKLSPLESPYSKKYPLLVAKKIGMFSSKLTMSNQDTWQLMWCNFERFHEKKTPTKYIQLFSGRINDYVDLFTYGSSSFSFEIFGISPEKREIFANRIRQCWQNHTFGTTKNRKIFCQCSYSSWNKVSNVIFKWILFISKLSDSTIYFFNYSLR